MNQKANENKIPGGDGNPGPVGATDTTDAAPGGAAEAVEVAPPGGEGAQRLVFLGSVPWVTTPTPF